MKMLALAFGLLLSCFTLEGEASNLQGQIGNMVVGRNGNQVFVQLQAQTSAEFPCASHHPNFQYAFLTTNSGGKDMLATLLAAKMSGQAVLIVGSGVCNVDSQMEDVAYVWLP